MPIADEQIREITESIWASMFGVDLQRRATADVPEEPTLIGCVQISGAWEGAVTLRLSAALARRAAALMFGSEEHAVTVEEVRDALGELANMAGGNFKNLLPGSCQLSLPAVTEGSDPARSVPGEKLVGQVGFECEGQPLLVSLLQNERAMTRSLEE